MCNITISGKMDKFVADRTPKIYDFVFFLKTNFFFDFEENFEIFLTGFL